MPKFKLQKGPSLTVGAWWFLIAMYLSGFLLFVRIAHSIHSGN